MSKEHPKLNEIGNKNPFRVPENYFEKLNEQLLEKIDTQEVEVPGKVNMWERVKPLVYLAAMFAGIALMFSVFNKTLSNGNDTDKLAKSYNRAIDDSIFLDEEDYDDFYDYLEYQAIEQNYREAVFISEY